MLKKAAVLIMVAVTAAVLLAGWHWKPGSHGSPQAGWGWGEDGAQIYIPD